MNQPAAGMRRKLLIGGLAVLGLLSILIISAIVYVRSGRLDQWLESQLEETLLERGIRAEIGKLSLDITGSRVDLEELKLYDRKGTRPFADVLRIEVQFSVVDYFRQKVNITRIDVVRPEVWIELDERGRSNLESLTTPPEPKKRDERITYLGARITLSEAKINFTDKRRDLTAVLPNLNATFSPLDASAVPPKLNHKLIVTSEGGVAAYEGRDVQGLRSEIEAVLREDQARSTADVTRLILSSDLSRIAGNGSLALKPLEYDFSLTASVSLAELARLLSPATPMNGQATLTGGVEGKGAEYRFAGSLASDSFGIEGYTIAGVKLNTALGGKGSDYSGETDALAAAIKGPGFAGSGLRVEANLSGSDQQLGVDGAFALKTVRGGQATVTDLRSRLAIDQTRVNLSEIRGNVFGGRLTGSGSMAYSGGESSLNLGFESIDLAQAAESVSPGDVRIKGNARGSARLTFPALNYSAAAGRISAEFEASVDAVSPEDSELHPVTPGVATGEIEMVARGRGFTIERATVNSAGSHLTATGNVDWKGVGALDVSFRSEDMSEVYRAIDALGLIPDRTKRDFEPYLSGPGEFNGTIRGELASPAVSGHLTIASVEGNNESLGSFKGDVVYEPQGAAPGVLRIENASLVGSDGSRAELTVEAPLPVDNNVSVKATLYKIDLARFTKAALSGLEKFVGGGVLSGKVDLEGLPGSRTITGTADVSLSGGEFNLPAGEDEDEPSKKSVPEFVGRVTIADSVLKVEGLRMRVGGDSAIAGHGSFNLDTYAYSVDAEGKNIDLANVSDAFSETTGLGGRADLTVTGSGAWDEWSTSTLNARIQGRDVTFRGRSLGDAKLLAATEGGLLKLTAMGSLNEEPHEVNGVIDLRDPDNYPISAEIEFTDSELAPYLKLVSPDLGSIGGVASGSVKISGPLKDTDRIQAVMSLTKLEIGGKVTADRTYIIANQGIVVIRATPKELSIEPVTFIGEGTSLTVGGSLWRDGAASQRSTGLSIDGEVNLRLITSFTQAVYATGIAQVRASVIGSLDSPQLTGFVNLRDIGLRAVDLPITLARGQGEIRFTANQALLERFTATSPGGGSITASGGAALSGLAPDRWRVEARADQVGIEFPVDTHTLFDSSLVLQGNRRLQVLSGDIVVRRAAYTKDVTVDELFSSEGPFGGSLLEGGGGAGDESGPATVLDLRVRADNTLVVRNNLADAVGSAYLTIRGNASQPLVSGRVLLSRGTLEFRNGRHELTRGLITLPGRRGAEPTIDFQAEAEISGYRVITEINGTASSPQVSLRSDPDLPDGDVISLILTGTLSGNGTTAAAANQSGQGLAYSILSASISETIGKRTQRLFGLRGFTIDPLIVGRGNDPTARLTISQRITKEFTITYSANLTSGPSGEEQIVLVEYRLSNRFSVVGFRNDRGDLGFDVRLRKRF